MWCLDEMAESCWNQSCNKWSTMFAVLGFFLPILDRWNSQDTSGPGPSHSQKVGKREFLGKFLRGRWAGEYNGSSHPFPRLSSCSACEEDQKCDKASSSSFRLYSDIHPYKKFMNVTFCYGIFGFPGYPLHHLECVLLVRVLRKGFFANLQTFSKAGAFYTIDFNLGQKWNVKWEM